MFQLKFDYLTSTYFLLLEKKLKGRPVRLIQHHKQSVDTPRVSVSKKRRQERQRDGSAAYQMHLHSQLPFWCTTLPPKQNHLFG